MTQQTINIGKTANDKSGDPLRVAFNKVNQNFDELYIRAFSASAISYISPTPPDPPTEGLLWWDSNNGNQYIYYDGAWVSIIANTGGGGGTPQRPSDWNAVTGVTRILNKPTIPTDVSQLSDVNGLLGGGGVNLTLDGGSASTVYDPTDIIIDGQGA